MNSFPNFYGNQPVTETLAKMLENRQIPQTILLSGPEGVGKATLVRRFAAALLGDEAKIERDDLSLPANLDAIEQREKWTADKRGDDPLLFSTHPDFLTFVPEGPLRQITIQQMRLLRERAQYKPLKGSYRVFLIDHLERANEQAANSLLKVLEEPPEHMILFATVENLYDLLPTIRSRAVTLALSKLSDPDMQSFVAAKSLSDVDLRVAISEGCPGVAATLDLATFKSRRNMMLAAFECTAGIIPFSAWIAQAEGFAQRKSEKLELYLKHAYFLLEDILASLCGSAIVRNRDVVDRIGQIASQVDFAWVEKAMRTIDELVVMVRRNIQKTASLDAMIIRLSKQPQPLGT